MPRSLINRLWYRFLRRFLQLMAIVLYRVRYSGTESIPMSGAVLIVSNHQSHLDPILVGVGSRRRMNYVARKTLFDVPLLGPIIHSVDAIPIDRDGFGIGGIKEALKRLKHGEMVLIFPEGTRTPDGQIARFRPGFTTLAVRSKAAILPVAVAGAYQVWPKTQKFPGHGRICVHFGKPIPPEEIAGRDEHELVPEIERRVRECFDEASAARAKTLK